MNYVSIHLTKWNVLALQGHIELLETLTDENFVQTREPVFPSSLGGHLRHDLDHYLNFFRGLPEGPIDYESRERDAELETNRGETHRRPIKAFH